MRGLVPVVIVVAACGGLGACGGDEELTCEMLADPGNCWADLAAQVLACLPEQSQTAIFSADRQSCTYGTSQIHFDAPLPSSTIELEQLAFDGTGPGCSWRFVDTFANRMELTVGNRTVVSELHPGGKFHLHCDNGTTYETDFDNLFKCAGATPPGPPPTDGFEVTPTSFQFSLSAVGIPRPLVNCAQ
jgi:hypothetical protein